MFNVVDFLVEGLQHHLLVLKRLSVFIYIMYVCKIVFCLHVQCNSPVVCLYVVVYVQQFVLVN